MHITKIISFNGAWELAKIRYENELQELMAALDHAVVQFAEHRFREKHTSMREQLQIALQSQNWLAYDSVALRRFNKVLNLRSLGPIKNGLSAAVPLNTDFLTRWIFNISTIAFRNRLIELPVILAATRELERKISRPIIFRENLEILEQQLNSLMPLNHQYPFLIIGYSDEPSEIVVEEILPFESESVASKVIDKSIEFPAEYHLAGLNILNFFGTYLREQYPEENAKVKIEQDGLIVRLIVESADGKSEVIEKALHEYQLVMTGKEPPESISQNTTLVLQLRNELRIAQLRVESQRDLLDLKSGEINRLFKLVEFGLSKSNHVNIDFHPTISATNILSIKEDVSNAISNVNQLKSFLDPNDPAFEALKKLERPLLTIQNQSDPAKVKKSAGLKKLKEFIDNVSSGNEGIEKTLKVVGKSWDVFKELAGNYNKIAQW